jgi:hypothetical protein
MAGEGVPSEFAFIERMMHGRANGLARNSRSRRSYKNSPFWKGGRSVLESPQLPENQSAATE